jgi:hypothetical protein
MLVIVSSAHHLVIYIFTIFFMLLKPTNICYLCTALLVIIVYSLNFIRIIFLLRIQPRGSLFFEVDMLAASTLCTSHGAVVSPEALLSVRPSVDLWHRHLGHPGSFSFRQVINQNKLLVAPLNNTAHVCNACQTAGSHQLPFSSSNNKSSVPLQLIHTDVWGPAIRS